MYSASVVDVATVAYLLLIHVMAPPYIVNTKPMVERRVVQSPA